MTTKRLWILGAEDSEMDEIEWILQTAGETVLYACVGADRVTQDNAYQTTSVQWPPNMRIAESMHNTLATSDIITVECKMAKDYTFPEISQRIDHHGIGDFGFDLPPEKYREASSIGQVLLRLHEQYEFAYEPRKHGDGYRHYLTAEGAKPIELPEEFENIAALDHCLSAAYKGQCPGIDLRLLISQRVRDKARQQDQEDIEVLNDINGALVVITTVLSQHGHIYDGVVDLRNRGVIPEIEEASWQSGIAVLLTTPPKEGSLDRHRKVSLIGASMDQVNAFLANDFCPELTAKYGYPFRGCAEGYITPKGA